MTTRKVEIFSAGCAVCNETLAMVRSIACPSCDIEVLDMHDSEIAARAKALGVGSLHGQRGQRLCRHQWAGRRVLRRSQRKKGMGRS